MERKNRKITIRLSTDAVDRLKYISQDRKRPNPENYMNETGFDSVSEYCRYCIDLLSKLTPIEFITLAKAYDHRRK